MSQLGSTNYDGLIAGDYPTKSTALTITGPKHFKRGDVIGFKTDGSPFLVDSTKMDGTQNPVGIICDDLSAETGETKTGTIYIKGEFSAQYLSFGGTDTAEKHVAAMNKIGLIVRGK